MLTVGNYSLQNFIQDMDRITREELPLGAWGQIFTSDIGLISM